MNSKAASNWKIRLATQADRARILDLVPRLRAFGTVALRSAHDLDIGECRTVNRYFDSESVPDQARLWVAESANATVEGAVYAERAADYFTREPHGHIGILMVSEDAEGTGIARLLVEAVENWCRACGFRFLTLNVFAGNERAQSFYERASFRVDTLRYIKPIAS
jgi:GNAT superfamily N-acetyltransferase